MLRIVAFILLLACVPAVGVAQMQPATKSAVQSAATQKTSQETQRPAIRKDDVQALREDITRMKALVQQMQTNLAFVDTTQSPLKHQFQLEIEMWQTMITEMDRRLDQAARPAQSKGSCFSQDRIGLQYAAISKAGRPRSGEGNGSNPKFYDPRRQRTRRAALEPP